MNHTQRKGLVLTVLTMVSLLALALVGVFRIPMPPELASDSGVKILLKKGMNFLLPGTLGLCLYLGYRWARWAIILVYGAWGLFGLSFYLVSAQDKMLHPWNLLGAVLSIILVLFLMQSAGIRSFMRYQRRRRRGLK